MLFIVAIALAFQGDANPSAVPSQDSMLRNVTATRAGVAPAIDGRDDDAVWKQAPRTVQFREARPAEDGLPQQQTAFQVAYDAHYLYVFVRAFDTHPDSIVSLLSRRDAPTASDQLSVFIDSYHDRRTGYEFRVNPAGVKADYAIYNDGQGDDAWDAIWDVATRVDSSGWTAEYRIPLSQLRFAAAPEVTFGFAVWRTLQRHTALITWPLSRMSKSGMVSQFGELNGLRDLATPRRAEVAPYLLSRNASQSASDGFSRRQGMQVGGDLKYGVASNLTLNATVNPDFGQVEADPSVLNLSAFETFLSERRPFFVEGAGLFDFRANCFAVVDCRTGEGLFYTRRIGRAPELAGRYGDAQSPTATRILGAAKLAGRLPGGLSIGVLDAVTDRIGGVGGATIAPRANYAVLRMNQDYAAGNGSVGAMVTGVNRSLDQWTEPFMHQAAYTGGIDARRRLGRYEFSGALMASRVSGTEVAIALTQRRPTHYFQRPDDGIAYDSSRTSLSGYSTELRFAKVGGQHTAFETGYGRRSAGFELNDIGFLQRADQQTWTNWFTLRFNDPNRVYQRLNWNFNWWQYWTLNGLPTERVFNTNVHTQFSNRWWLHAGASKSFGQVYCDRNCTRGGPALKTEPFFEPWAGVEGDDRRVIVPAMWVNYRRGDGGRSRSIDLQPSVRANISSRVSSTVGLSYTDNKDNSQWYGNVVDASGAPHYTFAALDQETLGLTFRVNYTFTPEASLQLYANPFVSKGSYNNIRELADPRAAHYDDRFQPWQPATATATGPTGFNVKEFRSNAVFRWEYRPGSTLFLVWSQGRQQFSPTRGNAGFRGDYNSLFGQRADDTFLIKMSYWLGR
ncbi:MAG: DUF5916 domain-containing protein [Gemmatimonadales bacterium]